MKQSDFTLYGYETDLVNDPLSSSDYLGLIQWTGRVELPPTQMRKYYTVALLISG